MGGCRCQEISLFWVGGRVLNFSLFGGLRGWGGWGGLWRVFWSCLEKGFSPVFGGLFRERRGENLSGVSHKVFFCLTINTARFPLLNTLLYYNSLVSCPPAFPVYSAVLRKRQKMSNQVQLESRSQSTVFKKKKPRDPIKK